MIAWLTMAGLFLAVPAGFLTPVAPAVPALMPPAVAAEVRPVAVVPLGPAGPLLGAPAVPAAPDGVRAPVPDRWIAEDKARHFALSFAATSMAYGGARLGLDPEPGRRTAAAVGLLLGVGKELMDARSGGPFSMKDLAWDAAGVALGFLLAQQIR